MTLKLTASHSKETINFDVIIAFPVAYFHGVSRISFSDA